MSDAARWHEFAYEQTDIPAGTTVRDWRIQRARRCATSCRWSPIVGVLRRMVWRRRSTDANDRRRA